MCDSDDFEYNNNNNKEMKLIEVTTAPLQTNVTHGMEDTDGLKGRVKNAYVFANIA